MCGHSLFTLLSHVKPLSAMPHFAASMCECLGLFFRGMAASLAGFLAAIVGAVGCVFFAALGAVRAICLAITDCASCICCCGPREAAVTV